MDTEALARLLVEDVWNGAGQRAEELVDPSCPGLDGTGPSAVVAWHRDRRSGFPDLRYEVLHVVAAGATAALRWRARGRQDGAFGPVPPTGRVVEYEGASFLTFRGGRLVDVWSVDDLFGLVEQLGATVQPPSTPGPAAPSPDASAVAADATAFDPAAVLEDLQEAVLQHDRDRLQRLVSPRMTWVLPEPDNARGRQEWVDASCGVTWYWFDVEVRRVVDLGEVQVVESTVRQSREAAAHEAVEGPVVAGGVVVDVWAVEQGAWRLVSRHPQRFADGSA